MRDSIWGMVRSAWTPLLVVLLTAPATASTQPLALTVRSPDGSLQVSVGLGADLTWSVNARGRTILEPSRLSMTLDDGRTLGRQPVVTATSARSADTVLHPVVRLKREAIRDHFNERRIDFAGEYLARRPGV